MSAPLIPNFTIPSIFPFISPTTQATSPFSSQQQNVLINIANALTSYSNVGSLTGDIFGADNQLFSNGVTLTSSVGSLVAFAKLTSLTQNPTAANNAIADLISTESKLSPSNLSSFVSSLSSLTAHSSQIDTLASDNTLISNLSVLNNILTSPSSFIISIYSSGSIGSSGISPQKLTSDSINTPTAVTTDLLSIITNGTSPGSPYTSTLALIEALVSTPGAFVQQFITPGYITGLFPTTNISPGLTSQKLISDLFTSPGSVQGDFVTVVTNNTKAGSPYSSPLAVIEAVVGNPSGFVQQFIGGSYIAGLFSGTKINSTSPITLVTDMISNPSNFAGDFSGLFNSGSIGSSGVKPFQIIYDMFTNPGNVLTDFQYIIWNGVFSGWGQFLPSIFSGSTITSNYSTTTISPATFISDLISLGSNLRTDIGQLVIQGLDDGLYNLPHGPPSALFSGSPGLNTWINSMIGVGVNGGNPAPIISNFLNITPISNFYNLASGIPNNAFGLADQFINTFGSFLNGGSGLFSFFDLVTGNPANESSGGEYVLGEYIRYNSSTDQYQTDHTGFNSGNYGGGWLGYILALLSNINADIGDAFNGGWSSTNNLITHAEDGTKVLVWTSGILYAMYQILIQFGATIQQAMTYTQFFNGGLSSFHGNGPAVPNPKITNIFTFPPAGF